MMINNTRPAVTRITRLMHLEEDRAWTSHHHGQLTIAHYLQLDLFDYGEITPVARVRTERCWRRDGLRECLGVDADGWLVRAYFDTGQWHRTDYREKYALFAALPYLRLVDDVTGFSYPESYNVPDFSADSARLMDVSPPRSRHHDAGGDAYTSHFTGHR